MDSSWGGGFKIKKAYSKTTLIAFLFKFGRIFDRCANFSRPCVMFRYGRRLVSAISVKASYFRLLYRYTIRNIHMEKAHNAFFLSFCSF